MRIILLATFAMVVLATCSDQQRSTADDRTAIDSLRAEHVMAVNSRNIDLLLSGMSEDVVYLAPDAPPAIGRDTLDARVRPVYEAFNPDITMTPREVVINGNLAFEWGCLGGSITPVDSGAVISNDGKYLYIYRWRAETGWKIARDMYTPGPCE